MLMCGLLTARTEIVPFRRTNAVAFGTSNPTRTYRATVVTLGLRYVTSSSPWHMLICGLLTARTEIVPFRRTNALAFGTSNPTRIYRATVVTLGLRYDT